jgi:MYM-type Zinc finger with FCS sequence motif
MGREYVKLKKFSDGTTCDYCKRIILTKLGLNYKENGKNFCCKECADDYAITGE